MKIIYKIGDALAAEEPVVCHGCNARGVFASGFAAAVAKRYPQAREEYLRVHRDHGLRLGQIIWVECGNHIVVNAITQEFYGRDGKKYVNDDAIRMVMRQLNEHPYFRQQGIFEGELLTVQKAVAMPRIGAGLGGGDWSVISAIIEEEMTEVQPVVYDLPGANAP